jgi:3',5'-cyclic AMP phosphodiesterase CpdA
MRRAFSLLPVLWLTCSAWAQLPNQPGSFRFAVIGDSGTGGRSQYEVGARLADIQKKFPFQTVVMLGDNIYGGQTPKDFQKKFEWPYIGLLNSGVKFYASLGNHDSDAQQSYKLFNMGRRRYYSFTPQEGVHFFALDSNRVDQAQLAWLEEELAKSGGDWKIVYMHHPLYSSGGRHGSSLALRKALEPLLVKYGVAMALAGHDHFYERITPQMGICHFVIGGSAKVRVGDCLGSELTAKSFDRDNSFALMEINGDTLHFQAISRTGKVVDEGSFQRPPVPERVTSTASKAAR